MGFDALQLRAASRALIHRSPGRVGKLMGLPEVGKLAHYMRDHGSCLRRVGGVFSRCDA